MEVLEIFQQLKVYESGRLLQFVAEIPPFLWWWVIPGLVGVGAIVLFFSALFGWKIRGILRAVGALGAVAFVWVYTNILTASMVAWGSRYVYWYLYWCPHWDRASRAVSICCAYHHRESCLTVALYVALVRLVTSTVIIGIAAAVITLLTRSQSPKKTIDS